MNRMLLSILSFALLAVIGVSLHHRLAPKDTVKQTRFLPVFQALPESQTSQSIPPATDAEGGYAAVNHRRLAELEKASYQGPTYREVLQASGPRLALRDANTNRIPASEEKPVKKPRKGR